MSKYFILIIMLLSWSNTYACSIPRQGTYWSHDELIAKTETIQLVTPVSSDHRYKFKVLETLKGNSSEYLQWHGFRPRDPHRSEDFDGHNNPEFWKGGEEKIIRATYYPGACTLQFTFIAGEKYLIFKESSGNVHSAEIIKTSGDKWYKYVRATVTHNKASNATP